MYKELLATPLTHDGKPVSNWHIGRNPITKEDRKNVMDPTYGQEHKGKIADATTNHAAER